MYFNPSSVVWWCCVLSFDDMKRKNGLTILIHVTLAKNIPALVDF